MGKKLLWFLLCFSIAVFVHASPVHGQNLSPDEAVPGEILVRYTEMGAKTADDMIAGAPAPSQSAVDFWQSFTNWLGLSDTTPEMEARVARETLEDLAGRFGVTDQTSLGRNQKGTRTIKLGAQQVFTNPSARTGIDPLENVYLISFQTGTIDEFVTAMNESGLSVEAQPNYRYQAEAVPNDADYPSQWSHQRIGSEQAWNTVTGSQTIVVAVLDTGVMYSHPDLNKNMWQGDVGGGQTGYGFDYCATSSSTTDCLTSDADPNDDNGHGTHVAGIIGAEGNNNVGIAGVNWSTRIMAVRVLNSGGRGTTASVAQGIRFAADNGARVMNVSLGQVSACDQPDTLLATVIADATSKRALLVVAGGNSHINAACDSPSNDPNVLVVTARGPQDETASYTNYGPLAWKDLKIVSAPGGATASGASCTTAACILSTQMGGGYASAKGTSFAAPVVSGLAALILSVRDMDPAALRTHIISSAVDKNDDFTTTTPNPDIPNDDGKRTYGKLISSSTAISNLIALAVTTTPGPSDSRIPVGTTDTLIINIIGQTTVTPTLPAGATATPPVGSTLTPTVRPPTVTPGGPTATPIRATMTPTVRPPTVTPGGPANPPCQGDSDNDGESDSDDDNDGKDCDNDSRDDDGDKDDEKDDEKEVSVKLKIKKNGKVSRLPNNASVSPGSLISICFNIAAGKTNITVDTGKGRSVQFSKTYSYSTRDRCFNLRGQQFIPVGDIGKNLSSRTIKITIQNGNQIITKTIRVMK